MRNLETARPRGHRRSHARFGAEQSPETARGRGRVAAFLRDARGRHQAIALAGRRHRTRGSLPRAQERGTAPRVQREAQREGLRVRRRGGLGEDKQRRLRGV